MTTAPTSQETSPGATEPVLEPKLDARWALSPSHITILLSWIVFYLLLSYIPLRGTDLWGHTMLGKWIIEHKSLPAEDPFQPLAEGMPVTDGAWLSQVIFAEVEARGGAEWLSCLFAVVGLCTYLVLSRAYYLQCRRPWVMMAGVAGAVAVGWSRLLTIRPETFGALCLAILLWLLVSSNRAEQAAPPLTDGESSPDVRRDRPWRMWIGVPLIFLLWANLHGSFVCGVAVLGCYFLGRVIEVAWKTRDFRSVVEDRQVRRRLLWTELAVVATLINPYGVDLWLETLQFSGNENLQSVLEWQPLVILGIGGIEFGLSWAVLTLVLRHSRQPMPVAHVLMLIVFSIGVVFGIRMLTWYAMVFGLVLTPHLNEIVSRWLASRQVVQAQLAESRAKSLSDKDETEGEQDDEEEGEFILPPGRSWVYSLIALLLIWIAFAISPLMDAVRGKQSPRRPDQIFGKETPRDLTAYLRENPPQGQIYNPQWWGDWLVFDGPKSLQPFVTSNIHLAPRQVWMDYMSVLMAQADWRLTLDKYRVNTVVLDKGQQRPLISLLRRQQGWRIAYNDDQAIVFERVGSASADNTDPNTGQESDKSGSSDTTTPDNTVESSAAETQDNQDTQPHSACADESEGSAR